MQLAGLRFRLASPGPTVAARLRGALEPYVVGDDEDAPEAYVLSGPDGGRGLYVLLRFDCPVARARSAARVLDALRRHLAADAGWHPPDLVPIRAAALRTGHGIVLLPDGLRRKVVPHSRRLADGGVAPVDEPVVGLDAASGEVVVPAAPLDLPDAAVDAFNALGGQEAPQPPGAHALRGVAVPPGVEAADVPAVMALHLLALVVDGAVDPDVAVDAVLDAVEHAEGIAMPAWVADDPAALLRQLD